MKKKLVCICLAVVCLVMCVLTACTAKTPGASSSQGGTSTPGASSSQGSTSTPGASSSQGSTSTPGATSDPVAADPIEDNGIYATLYKWNPAEHTVTENAAIMKNNSVPRTNYEYDPVKDFNSRSNHLSQGEIYLEDGVQSVGVFGMSLAVHEDGGLQTVSTGNQRKQIETLKIELTELEGKPLDPADYEAMALTHVYALCPSTTDVSILLEYDSKYEVRTNKGNSWTVGLQNWALMGSGLSGSTKAVFFRITSENLIPDTVKLAEGEWITGITYYPFGMQTATWLGNFRMSNLEIRGYHEKKAYEEEFPVCVSYTHVDEATLRDIVIDEAKKLNSLEWISNAVISTENAAGQSGMSTTTRSRDYPAGVPFRGPFYQRSWVTSTESMAAQIDENGIYIGGYTNATTVGMDCGAFVYNAQSRVSRTAVYTPFRGQLDETFKRLGNVKAVDDFPRFTDTGIIAANDDQTMYESYALLKKGDPINMIKESGSGVHIRMAYSDAVVVRNADGTINPDKSYVTGIEQTSTTSYHVQMADGKESIIMTNDYEGVFDMIEANPGSKILYGTCMPIKDYTFASLLKGGYVAYTLEEYQNEQVENACVQIKVIPQDSADVTKGLHVTAASNFRLIDLTVKLEDLDQGTVLYEGKEFGFRSRYTYQAFDMTALDAILATLTNGNYRLTVAVTSGPLTQVGADMPVTTYTEDFKVEGKEPAAKATLTLGSDKLTAGSTVTVKVNIGASFSVADVEVRFDAEALSFVSGSVTPACMLGEVTQDQGVARIICVDADANGELATLTFQVNKDTSADAIAIKSAMISTADAAVDSNMNKAF